MSGISPSSVITSHLEPPSNQSSHLNNYAPQSQWSEEEDKMVGMKRCYPFSLKSPPAPSLLCSFRPSYATSSSGPDKLVLCSTEYTAMAGPRNKCIRGSPLPGRMPNEVTREDDESLIRDLLALTPPSSSKLNHNHHSDYKCKPSQEHDRNQIHQTETSGSVKQSFDFFPIKLPTDTHTNRMRNGKDEEGDTIDLSLKL